jgi:hypothetical protein
METFYVFKGLRIMGFEGSRWYNGGPMQYTEQQMNAWWENPPIVVVESGSRYCCHPCSPRHIHDAEDLCHKGFQTFRQLIDRYQPRYFFHGHVHAVFDNPSERITTINKTNVVNCCGYYFLDIETHQKSELPKHEALSKKICNFDQRQEIEAAYDYRKRGIRCVLLDQIIGSVGRYHDFDRQFKLKPHLPSERFEQVKKAMLDGKPMPPVKLYQIKEDYYVLDGNHRIAAARALGRKDISAEIVELIPSKNSLENILYLERSEFEDKTGISPGSN